MNLKSKQRRPPRASPKEKRAKERNESKKFEDPKPHVLNGESEEIETIQEFLIDYLL